MLDVQSDVVDKLRMKSFILSMRHRVTMVTSSTEFGSTFCLLLTFCNVLVHFDTFVSVYLFFSHSNIFPCLSFAIILPWTVRFITKQGKPLSIFLFLSLPSSSSSSSSFFCVCVCVKERRKIELTVWGKKMPIALDGIRTCISGIRAHSASDCTTTAGTPPVSRNKHFRHSPVSSIVKQSCMKHSNSYLRDRDAKHLQGPPLSRTRRVRERRKIELTVWGKKVPIALDGIRTCISGIRAHSTSDCTTTAGTPPVSRNKHFRHSPVSSIVKQSCMKHSNSYLRDRDAKHLQGPPLSRTRRVRERRKIELTVWGKKVPIALDGIRTCISGIRAHSASDCTTTASLEPGPSRASYFPREMLLLTTTARERAWRLLKITSPLIGWFDGDSPIPGISPWLAPLSRCTQYIVEVQRTLCSCLFVFEQSDGIN